jgi:hypothetical protein
MSNRSDDVGVPVGDLHGFISNLKKIEVDESVSDLYAKKVDLLVELFDLGAKIYKEAQQSIIKVDTRILNEHQYYSRALNTLMAAAKKGSIGVDQLFAIDDALTAAKHIVNDTVDIVVMHALIEIKRLSNISALLTIGDVYGEEKYEKLLESINFINQKIALTRRSRGIVRVEEYIEFVRDGGGFDVVAGFCRDVEQIELRLRKLRRQEHVSGRVALYSLIVSIIAVVVSIVK